MTLAGGGLSQARVIYGIFFVQALAFGGLFPRIPDLQTSIGLSEYQLGLAMTISAGAGLACLIFAGKLVRGIGTRAVICASIPVISLMQVLSTQTTGLTGLTIAFSLGAMAFSFSNVAINVEADRIEAFNGVRVMNRCHGFWSIGMLVASLLGVAARAIPVSALLHLALSLGVVMICCCVIVLIMRAAPARNRSGPPRKFGPPSRLAIGLTLFSLSAGVGQMSVQNWSVIFMRDIFEGPDWVDTLTLPAFLITLTIGRLYADNWADRFGVLLVSRVLAGTAGIGALCVVFAPTLTAALLGFALIGLGTAAIFPMAVSAAASGDAEASEENVSALIFLTGLVFLVFPVAIGWIAELSSLRVAFAFTVPFYFLSIAMARLVGRTA